MNSSNVAYYRFETYYLRLLRVLKRTASMSVS